MSSSQHFPDMLPKMTTKESNGEVSASIEETNRVRALLGLKPLNVGCAPVRSKKSNKDPNKSQHVQKSSEINIEALHKKLAKKHKSVSMIRGISLSEELETNALENYSASLWVQKSRHLAAKQQEKERKIFKKHMESLYDDEINEENETHEDRKHLEGKIVNHNVESFKKGESKILILKDQQILDSKMNINQDEDELINVEMYEKELRTNKLNEIENKKRLRTYNPLDGDSYNELLPQYKDKQDITKNKQAFTLNQAGSIAYKNEQILQSLNEDTNTEKHQFETYDLSEMNKREIASDYKVRFKKKKKHKKKKRKKKRKHMQNEDESQLQQDTKRMKLDANEIVQHKSRAKRDEILAALKLSEEEEKAEKEKMLRYNMALNKANESMANNLAINEILNKLQDDDNSEEDDVFKNTLHRAQILEEKQENNDSGKMMMDVDDDKNNNNVLYEEEEEEECVVFSIASQFSDGLNNVMNEMNEDNNDVIMDKSDEIYDVENAVIVDNEDKDDEHEGGWIECDGDQEKNRNKNKKAKRNKKVEVEEVEVVSESILDREPLCYRSLSDTLSHIRRRGYLENDEIESYGVDAAGNKHFKPANIGISKQKKEEIKRWEVDRVLLWLKESDHYLYKKYKDNFLKKRINGEQLINSCGSSSFLRGVIGMRNGHLDISKFMNILGELRGDPAPDIALTHNDQYGQSMTAKEAFRKLSHKFHGKKSGPKKEEKRLKKRNLNLQRRKQNNIDIDTPRKTLQKLKETTKQINKPFVVLHKDKN